MLDNGWKVKVIHSSQQNFFPPLHYQAFCDTEKNAKEDEKQNTERMKRNFPLSHTQSNIKL
jgi:hypothetical protein